MATFKHISSKNADYGAAEQYLTFEHDEFTMKPTLDGNGQLVIRDDYRISSLNCGEEDFAIACMRSNLKYGKNQKREDVKSHHYIISFDPRDAPDNGLTVDRAQALGEEFCKTHFPGHQALVCTHPDGHNQSGNIHVHIVINSLRIADAQGCRTTTLRGIKPKIKHFLLYVASLGFDDLKALEISDINSYLPVLADSYGNVGDSLSLLRSFGAYLSENSLCSLNLETIFTIKVPNRKKIHSGFDKDEVTAILNAPDRSTALGKRDYAIIMLAAHTGLRGVDVLTLRFSDIDWRLREIRLIQSKTSKPVMLPVPVAVLNAVAEYILEARPENTATDIIFLRSRPPYDPLKTWSAHSIIKHNAAKAGIAWQADERKGFHTMRRTLASRMLASDVSIDTIKEVLGHSSPDSTKPYISVELSGLKECPLTLESIPLGREELR